jgi:phosphatidyl-myo-inositol alpha-mannosyltransferase
LKIAQVCPYDVYRPGGVQHHILDLAAALQRMGHDVTILAPRANGKTTRAKSRASHLHSIVQVGNASLLAHNQTSWELTVLGNQRKRLSEVLQTGRFDVIHFHTLLTPFLPFQIFRRSQSANVASFHDVPPETPTGTVHRVLSHSLGRWLMPKLDGIILASEVQKRVHRTDHLPTSVVLPPCTNLRRFEISDRPVERYRDHRVNILFLGRLEPRKGAMVLLQAYHGLCRRGLPVRLLVAGDGPERPSLDLFVRKHCISDVVFLGEIDDGDVPRWYATCDIFCAPSLYAEGFGIVISEAMASGKPVVAAANAGYRTLLHGKAAQFLAKPGDVEAIGGRLETLISNQLLREQLGNWGRSEAKRYDSHTLAPQFEVIYERAIRARLHRLKHVRASTARRL